MNYTPEFIALEDPNRIVPRDEGVARLRQIREHVESPPEPAAKDAIAMRLAALRADCAEARREMEPV